MRILVDTNIVVRLANAADPDHLVAQTAVSRLRSETNQLCIVPQVMYEYWVVATKPTDSNGLGMSPADADVAVTHWLRLFRLLRDERMVFWHWRELVRIHSVSGRPAHDARLAAAMQRHGVEHLLTFNGSDFRRYKHVSVLAPEQVSA